MLTTLSIRGNFCKLSTVKARAARFSKRYRSPIELPIRLGLIAEKERHRDSRTYLPRFREQFAKMRVVRRHRAQALKHAEMRIRLSGDVELNLTRRVKSIARFLFLYSRYLYFLHLPCFYELPAQCGYE
jgi:hypothetical protein